MIFLFFLCSSGLETRAPIQKSCSSSLNIIFSLGAFPSRKNKDKGFGHPKSEMGKTPQKKPPPKEGSSSDEEADNSSGKKSCPICGYGNYKYARGVHTHIQRKHPGYKKLSEMKMKISEACRAEKRRCPNCNSLQANLSR